MDEQNFDEVKRLVTEFRGSEAFKAESRLAFLVDNFSIFDKNYQECKNLVVAITSPDNLAWWDVNERDKQRSDLIELARLTLNFLASAFALVDITRILIEDYYTGTEFATEYQNKIDTDFKNNSFAQFVQRLRNYVLHYHPFFTQPNLDITRDTETGDFVHRTWISVSKSLLEKWSGWERGSEFLDKSEENISITDIIDNYYNLVLEFRIWMHKRLIELHADDLAWLATMRERFNELYGNGVI